LHTGGRPFKPRDGPDSKPAQQAPEINEERKGNGDDEDFHEPIFVPKRRDPILSAREHELLDDAFGFPRYKEGNGRLGWLLNIRPVCIE